MLPTPRQSPDDSEHARRLERLLQLGLNYSLQIAWLTLWYLCGGSSGKTFSVTANALGHLCGRSEKRALEALEKLLALGLIECDTQPGKKGWQVYMEDLLDVAPVRRATVGDGQAEIEFDLDDELKHTVQQEGSSVATSRDLISRGRPPAVLSPKPPFTDNDKAGARIKTKDNDKLRQQYGVNCLEAQGNGGFGDKTAGPKRIGGGALEATLEAVLDDLNDPERRYDRLISKSKWVWETVGVTDLTFDVCDKVAEALLGGTYPEAQFLRAVRSIQKKKANSPGGYARNTLENSMREHDTREK